MKLYTIDTGFFKLAIDAGANILVAGTSIFKAGDETYSKSIKRLRNLNP